MLFLNLKFLTYRNVEILLIIPLHYIFYGDIVISGNFIQRFSSNNHMSDKLCCFYIWFRLFYRRLLGKGWFYSKLLPNLDPITSRQLVPVEQIAELHLMLPCYAIQSLPFLNYMSFCFFRNIFILVQILCGRHKPYCFFGTEFAISRMVRYCHLTNLFYDIRFHILLRYILHCFFRRQVLHSWRFRFSSSKRRFFHWRLLLYFMG